MGDSAVGGSSLFVVNLLVNPFRILLALAILPLSRLGFRCGERGLV